MIVVDASVAIAVLRDPASLPEATVRWLDEGVLNAPELIDLEVLQVFRRLVRNGEMDQRRADEALLALKSVPVRRHSHRGLIERIWQLRTNLSAYDAAYVALAEALEATLVTRDAGLARASGVHAQVEVV